MSVSISLDKCKRTKIPTSASATRSKRVMAGLYEGRDTVVTMVTGQTIVVDDFVTI